MVVKQNFNKIENVAQILNILITQTFASMSSGWVLGGTNRS